MDSPESGHALRRYPRPGRKACRRPDDGAVGGGARPRCGADQAGRRARPAGGDRRMAGGLAGQGAARGEPAAGRGLCRQSRRRRPRRLGLSRPRSPRRWSTNFAARRRGHQPDLPRLRSRPEGATTSRSTIRPATSPRAPALDEVACAATIAFGMEAIAGGVDLLCIGEMGIGNTTVAAAIYRALFGGTAEDWVGPGTGLDPAGIARKCAAVSAALAFHRRPPRRSPGGAPPPRRPRDRGDGRRDPRGADEPRAGHRRRLRRHRRRGDPPRGSTRARSTTASSATSRPSPPTPGRWRRWASGRSSTSGYGSAKAPAPRSPRASSRLPHGCTPAWRRLRKRGCRRRGRRRC